MQVSGLKSELEKQKRLNNKLTDFNRNAQKKVEEFTNNLHDEQLKNQNLEHNLKQSEAERNKCKLDINKLESKIALLEKEKDDISKEKVDSETALQQQLAKLSSDHDAVIAKMDSDHKLAIAKMDSDHKAQLALKDSEIDALKVQLASKDSEIDALKLQLANQDPNHKKEVDGLNSKINELQSQVDQLQKDKQEVQEEVKKLQSGLEVQNAASSGDVQGQSLLNNVLNFVGL